jgi:hypothetical protein
MPMASANNIKISAEPHAGRGGTALVIAQLSAALLILQFVFRSTAGSSNVLFFNAVFCVLLLTLTSIAALRYVTLNRLFVLTPVPWFYAACALFFGIGPLLWNFADQATIAYVDISSRVPMDNLRIMDANLLSIGGIAIVTATLAALQFLFDWEGKAPQNYLDRFSPEALARIFWLSVIIGLTIKYALILPVKVGLASYEIPNFISQLTAFLKVAIIVGYLARARGVQGIAGMHFALIGTELLTAAMSASKTEIFTVVLMIMIGRFLAQRTMKQAFLFGAAAATMYIGFLANFVLFLRINYSVSGVTSVGELFDAATEYFASDNVDQIGQAGVQLWWARLTFSNFQVFAIDAYDSGRFGETFLAALWAFAPRFLFPNKPNLNAGGDFSEELLTGSSEWVQTSMTYFAEGYWNMGVWGLVIVCVWAAFVYFVLTYIVLMNVSAGRIGILLMASVAIPLGLGVDAWFASGLVGGFALALLYAAVGYAYDRIAINPHAALPLIRAFKR